MTDTKTKLTNRLNTICNQYAELFSKPMDITATQKALSIVEERQRIFRELELLTII